MCIVRMRWVDAEISNECRGSTCLGVFYATALHMTCDWALVYAQSFNTALLLAVKHAQIGTVRLLVDNGANTEAKDTVMPVVHFIRDKSQADDVGAGCGFSVMLHMAITHDL